MKNKKKLWWLALPAAVIFTIVYLNYEPVFFNRKTIRVNKKTEVATNNWMKDLNGELHLSEINIPGVHDAATNHVQLSFFSRCQYFGIYDINNGKEVIPCKYLNLNCYENGISAQNDKGNWGVLDYEGKVILEPIYKNIIILIRYSI